MLLEEDALFYQSENITINNANLGQQAVVRTTFLEKARKMVAPEITELWFRLSSATAGAITGNALGKDAAKLIKKVIAKDDDEWLNLSGQSLRVLEQVEYGSKQKDPADVASGATSTTYKALIKLSFHPLKAERPRDFHLPLVSLLDAGEFMIQQCDAWPTGWATSSSFTLKVFAKVVEGRKKEAKSRRQLNEVSFNLDDTTYPLGGSVRGLYMSSVLTTTGATALTGVTAVNSTTLELPPDMPTDLLVDRYRMNSDALGTNDEVEAGNVIPLICPDKFQKVGAMADLRNFHIKAGSTPTSAIFIRDLVVDRPPEITSKAMGYGSVADYQQDLVARGTIVDAKGKGRPVTSFNPTLVRRMPVRIEGGGE